MENRDIIAKEIISKINTPFNEILLLSPRVGKTKIGIELIKKFRFKSILWVTSSVKLRDEDIPSEFIKWKAKSYLPKTTIVHYSSLDKQYGDYDLVVLDEIQNITENNSRLLLEKKIKYNNIIGLTGTMPEHQEKLEILKKLKLYVSHEISIDEAVDKDLIADYKINVVELPLDRINKNVKGGTKTKPFMTTEFDSYSYQNKLVNQAMFSGNSDRVNFAVLARRRFISNSPTKFNFAKKLLDHLQGRKLVFCGSIDQAEKISKYTYHSKTNDVDLQLFMSNKIDVLACVNAGGTGFTYTNVQHFIILQVDSNKSGQTTQKLARSLLKQKDYTANIWILCLQGTQDEKWVENALKTFDSNKIEYINYKNLKI